MKRGVADFFGKIRVLVIITVGVKAQRGGGTRIHRVNFLELSSLVNAGQARMVTRVKHVITQMSGYIVDKFI